MSIHTLVLRAADFAGQVSFTAGVGFQEVAAVGAEDERSNGGHVCGKSLVTCKFWFVNKLARDICFAKSRLCSGCCCFTWKNSSCTLRAEPQTSGRLLGKAGGGPSLGSSDDRRRARRDECESESDGGRGDQTLDNIDKRRAGHHSAACTHANMPHVH